MTSPSATRALRALPGAVPGVALGAAALVAGALRHDKALHPVGHRGAGRLAVEHPDPGLLVGPLGTEGTHPCELRWSRAIGLPGSWPDIEGMALRLPGAGTDGGPADLLFASTGSQRWSRWLLAARRPGEFGVLTTLLPARAAGGPVTFRLTPEGLADNLPPAAYSLGVALGAGAWRPLGRVAAAWSTGDTTERFDPVAHQLAGTEQYPWVTTLREPAYRAARAAARARRG